MDQATIADDEALLERWVAARDGAAFAELAQRHGGLVYGTCRRILRDHHAAEDVAQECLIEFARKAGTVRSSVAGFLHALATARARNRIRDEAVRRRHEAKVEAPVGGDDEPAWDEVAPFVDEALAGLSDEQRVPLVLHFLDGRSQTQVARELGCDQATVSRRIADGVDTLRQRLRRVGITASIAALSAGLGADAAEAAPATLLAAARAVAAGQAGAATTAVSSAPLAAGAAGSGTFAALVVAAVLALAAGGVAWIADRRSPSPVAAVAAAAPTWPRGLLDDSARFPIGVWMQEPSLADDYRRAGVNCYVGLWDGATSASLAKLAAAGMRVVCSPDDPALAHRDDPTIVGWLGEGEPDVEVTGHGADDRPAIPPERMQAWYRATRQRDPTRPALVMLGSGVAWDGDARRGPRAGHAEDYPAYAAAADLLGFQCYPMNDGYDGAMGGNPWYVARGVDRLRAWSRDKPVWAWIECTRIHTYSGGQPSPADARAEAWMALIHGARGLVWFCHRFESDHEVDAALLQDPAMLAAVTAIDWQVAALAPALNSPEAVSAATVTSADPAVPVDLLAKRWHGATWLFAVAMRRAATTATFSVPAGTEAEVIGEGRRIAIRDGRFDDAFAGYGVHLYRIPDPR